MSPALTTALIRNGCMLVAAIAGGWIAFQGFKRRERGSAWQLVMLAGLLLIGAYLGIVMTGGGPTEDSFRQMINASVATPMDYSFLMKAGVLIGVLGAFGIAKDL